MSRYYKIVVEPAPQTDSPSTTTGGVTTVSAVTVQADTVFTNQTNGLPDPNGRMIEFDMPVAPFNAPAGFATVTIWGVSRDTIAQANNYNNRPIKVYGGMQNGLPLATAAANQQGILVSGIVWQAYGNWLGTNQSLVLVISTDPGGNNPPTSQSNPANIVFNWKQGTSLTDAISTTLTTAFPNVPAPKISISSKIVYPGTEVSFHDTIENFANRLYAVSIDVIGQFNKQAGVTTIDNYMGIQITTDPTTGGFIVYDGTVSDITNPPALILFQDLIGQPTWLNPTTLTFNTVMRADIPVGGQVTLPSNLSILAALSSQAQPQAFNYRSTTTFSGTFTITKLRHVGNSRAPDALSWISTFQAFLNNASAIETSPTNVSI